jgi:LmeA-like phospholipid-binding
MSGFAGRSRGRRRAPRDRRPRRRGRRWLIGLVVLIVLLVAADFVARAVAESVAASEFQKQGQLSSRPDVTIEGFPFLTQVASRDISDVKVSISDLKEGPVTVTSVNATATGIKLKSYAFNSGTITHLSGTLLINFASLGNTLTAEIGPLGALLNGAGLDVSAAGPDEVKASLNLIVTTGSATWRVIRVSPSELNIRLVSSSGLPSSLLGSMQSVNVKIPKLPLGLTVDSVSVTANGIVGTISGNNVAFGS